MNKSQQHALVAKTASDLTTVCKYLISRSNEDRARLFSVASSKKVRGNRHKQKYREFHLLNIRSLFLKKNKNKTTVRGQTWNRFYREDTKSPSLEIFKILLVLSNLLQMNLL